jgi:hypothetical protein
MVIRFLVGLLLVWGAFLVFMPKEELYFKLERELVKQGIEINEGVIEEGPFHLLLKDVSVYAKGIEIAHIEEVRCLTFLVYTGITLFGVDVDKGLGAIVPEHTERMIVTHTVMAPWRIFIEAEGSFGRVKGSASLDTRTLRLDMIEAKDIKPIRRYLKQGEKGWYYETAF